MTTDRNHTLKVLEDYSMFLVESQNALLEATINHGLQHHQVVELERSMRAARLLANALWATDVISHGSLPSGSEVKAAVGDTYIELEFPYNMITQTTLYQVALKRLPITDSLVYSNRAWRLLMGHVLRSIENQMPFNTPLAKADVIVTVIIPSKRVRDPDHFWFRPILDGFVGARIIDEDDFDHINLTFRYQVDRTTPALVVQLRPAENSPFPEVRSEKLDVFFHGTDVKMGL